MVVAPHAGNQYVRENGLVVPGMLGHAASAPLIETPEEQRQKRRPGLLGADRLR